MNDFIIRDVPSDEILNELEQIGFDASYRFIAQNKFKYKNIKIFGLTPAQANILKQTAISEGTDCATHREVIRGGIDFSDVILTGNYSQLEKIAHKLNSQPFKLPVLGEKIIQNLKQKTNKTKITGILNITPDSFSDGGLYFEPDKAIRHLINLIQDGADMIDIGAESTRPNSEDVSAKEQTERLKPVLEYIQRKNIKIPISVDTRSSETADFALNNGADIINDVSGFDYDTNMPDIIAKYSAGVIIQHSKGTPKTMQQTPEYKNITDEIFKSLKAKTELAVSKGIKNIIIDPGIGFGKTKEHNLQILNSVESFYALNYPVMIGVSRKIFLGVTDNNNELKDALTLAVSYPLIQKKIDYLRVHNVKLHKSIIELA